MMVRDKQPPKENPMSVGRHSGDHIWGYEVFADGRIRLSPGFADQFRSIMDREQGLLEMQEGIARFVADCLSICAGQRREWWAHLADDLGDGFASRQWQFNNGAGTVTPVPRDTDGSPKGTDPQGQDGEAATAGADEGGIANA